MSNQPYNGPRKKPVYNVISEWKLRLSARPGDKAMVDRNGRPRSPNLYITVKDNQPQLVCRTNIENDRDYGVITAGLDSITWSAIFVAVEEVANGTLKDEAGNPINEVSFPCKGFVFPGGQRSEAPVVKNMVKIGMNENKEIYIAVLAKDRPNIQFVFGPSEWHEVSGADGRPLDNFAKARLYALGYSRLMRDLVTHILKTEYKDPDKITEEREARKRGGNGGGGNGGGYQKKQYDGGGQQQQSSAPQIEEKLPW